MNAWVDLANRHIDASGRLSARGVGEADTLFRAQQAHIVDLEAELAEARALTLYWANEAGAREARLAAVIALCDRWTNDGETICVDDIHTAATGDKA